MARDPVFVHVFWGDDLLRTLRLGRARVVTARELRLPIAAPPAWRVLTLEGGEVRLTTPDGDARPIPEDGEARLEYRGITLVAERPGPRAFTQGTRPSRAQLVLGASLLAHAGLLLAAAGAPRPSPADLERDRLVAMRRYNVSIALRDEERAEALEATAARAKGEEGALGAREGGEDARRGVRASAIAEAPRFGMIGLLGGGPGGATGDVPAGWTSWGAGDAVGPWREAYPLAQAQIGVRAGEWDDNASYREFQAFLATSASSGAHPLDVRDRQFIVVRDADGKGVPSCWLEVKDAQGQVTHLRTTASGRALLFPRAEALAGAPLTVTARCGYATESTRVTRLEADGAIVVDLPAKRVLPASRTIELGFVLDTTGSMSEEIAQIKTTIMEASRLLAKEQLRVKVGLVEYKDRGDEFVTRVYKMTSDLEAFSRTIEHLEASGGGDTPEAVGDGLRAAIDELDWSFDATVKLAFLVGDAPPHLSRSQEPDYTAETRRFAHAGIPVVTVAASGMDDGGQVVWRQIAQYTGGTTMFILRGGAGLQSVGAGEPRTSCGGRHTRYTSGNLHELVLNKIKSELAAVDAHPMTIAGRGQDERPSPCTRIAQR